MASGLLAWMISRLFAINQIKMMPHCLRPGPGCLAMYGPIETITPCYVPDAYTEWTAIFISYKECQYTLWYVICGKILTDTVVRCSIVCCYPASEMMKVFLRMAVLYLRDLPSVNLYRILRTSLYMGNHSLL